MISLPALFTWEAQLQHPDGTKQKALFITHSSNRVHEMAQELYPECSVILIGKAGEWDDAS